MSLSWDDIECARLDRLRVVLLGAACTVRSGEVAFRSGGPGRPSTSTALTSGTSVSGSLLEVRRLWLPPLPTTSSAATKADSSLFSRHPGASRVVASTHAVSAGWGVKEEAAAVPSSPEPLSGPLYAFVRIKDADHRISGWFPLHMVHVKYPRALQAERWHAAAEASRSRWQSAGTSRSPSVSQSRPRPASPSPAREASDTTAQDAWQDVIFTEASRLWLPGEGAEEMDGAYEATDDARGVGTSHEMEGPASEVVTGPLLSGVYAEVTPGMSRTQRAKKQLDYLEERLLRDGKTPTTIRFFVYVGRYVFQPWYFAPYGLLHRDYDPLLPILAPRASASASASASGKGGAVSPAVKQEEGEVRCEVNPFIRDAYLCPFSLRVYSTFDQLRYETARYRFQRLRPPGYEIYRDDIRGVSCFEVNGSHHVTYCRHLFLLGKSFLENKLAGHDVHSYMFYVVCLHARHVPGYLDSLHRPDHGSAVTASSNSATAADPAMFFAGYFTWEKQVADCNLACIVTLPCFAGNSYSSAGSLPRVSAASLPRNIGQLMIAISYELAYRRRQIGSPERPLSDLGAAAYQRFWRRVLVKWLHHRAPMLLHTQHQKGDIAVALSEAHEQVTLAHRGGQGKGEAMAGADHPEKRRRLTMGASSRGRHATKAEVHLVGSEDDDDDDGSSETSTASSSSSVVIEEAQARTASTRRGRRKGQGKKRTKRGGGASKAAVRSAGRKHRATTGVPNPADPAEGTDGDTQEEPLPPILTIQQIASEVRLEEQDVLRTMLGMGLLHRSSEDRSVQLVVPEAFVAAEFQRLEQQERNPHYCTFDAGLLVDAKQVAARAKAEGGSGSRRA